jgi:hypothetical protein
MPMAIVRDPDVGPLVIADPLVPLVRELIAEVRGLRADLRRRERGQPDDRYEQLFAVLGGIVGTELAFDAAEVLEHADVDEALASALADCGLHTVEAIGLMFRSWRDRPAGGFVLHRDHRSWRLDKCT